MELDRTERLMIRVSKAEKRKFEKAAKDRHTRLSEFIRQAAHHVADQQDKKVEAA